MAISYVGGQVGGRAGAASTTNVTYALTGGRNSTPQAGDFVVITMAVGSQARNPAQAVTAPGTWSNLGQLNPNTQTYDTSMNVSYKFMGGTPDTTFTAPSTGNAQDAQNWTIQVFRGVDPTNPLDVAAVAASAVGSGRPNPGSITPVTAGAWVVICGAGAAATGAAYTAPANFTTNFLTRTQADTNDAMIGSGYWTGWTSGAVDPAQYTGGTTNAVDSWAAYTLALRPAPGGNVPQTVYNVNDSGTSATTIAATLSGVQAGSTIVAFVGWSEYTAGITCSVSDGTSYTAAGDGKLLQATDNQNSQVFYLENASSGSHTATATFSSPTGYRRIRLFEVAGVATSASEDGAAHQQQNTVGTTTDSISSSATGTTTNANDFVLGLTQDTTNNEPGTGTMAAGTGFTLIGTNQILAAEYKNVSSTGAQTATFTDSKNSNRTTHVLVLKVASASPDITLSLSGTQVAANAGNVTSTQQVSKALTGAQVTASVGTLGVQMSLALTGAQVAASAGTVTSSQALIRALTGAQAAAQADTLTASQQVTKALAGAQVVAQAGTVTPSQSTGNVDVALAGAQVVAQAGTLTASQQVTKALAGAQVVAQAGTLTASQQVTKALAGEQVAASAGSVGKQISLALTGVQVAASAGTVTPSQQVSKALTGAQVAAQAGTVGVTQSSNDVTVALTGAQVAASAGNVTPSQQITVALTGAQVAPQTGTVTTSQAVSAVLTGAQATANAGSLTPSQQVTKALTGAQVAAQAGTVGKQITIALTGAQVSAGASSITTSQTSFITLTGAQVSAEVGTLTASQQKSVALTGAQVAAQAGAVGKQFELFRALTGAEVTAQAGTITSSQNITIALTGAQAIAEAGTLTTAQAVTKALTGAQVSVQAGSLTAQREFFAGLFGSQITAQAGSLTTSQALNRTLVGSQAQARAGVVDAGVSLSLFVNIPLQGARVVALAGQFANTSGQCGYNRGRVVNE